MNHQIPLTGFSHKVDVASANPLNSGCCREILFTLVINIVKNAQCSIISFLKNSETVVIISLPNINCMDIF